jgi:leader peptidase (prepilin peptidase)/N-methyltransferase
MDAAFLVFAAVFGAITGSFLNAVIHRLPRGIGLGSPRRSFCPNCGKTVPWHENLPVVGWLLLRGKCSACGWAIPARYPLVEVLTAVLFAGLWFWSGAPLAFCYWVFAALLIAGTFIDFEHFIIPDSITWGGAAAGILLSILIPAMMGTQLRWEAGLWSLIGAAAGFLSVWAIVEVGKLAFGRIRHSFPETESFGWAREGDSAVLRIGSEELRWEDIFSRRGDVLRIKAAGGFQVDGRDYAEGELVFRFDRLEVGGKGLVLDSVSRISGRMSQVVIPREAMGFGDVKFMACIGAFLGWQSIPFVLFAGSVAGSAAGLAGMFLAKDRSGVRLPFGPFLALGALGWLFGGRDWFLAYFSAFGGLF